jgi:hypothetical protein
MTMIQAQKSAKKEHDDAICGDCLYYLVDCNCREG